MIFKIIIFAFSYFVLNKFFIYKNVLLDKIDISKHKQGVAIEKKTPLTGGLVFVIFMFFTPILKDQIFVISVIMIYLLGLLSDVNILSSPSKRIFFQSLIIISMIFFGNLEIRTISIDFFDKILEINFFNIIFLLFCLLVLVNGSNFLDGLNTLVVVYFLICLVSIFISSNYYNLILDYELLKNIIVILSIISLFNFLGKSFLGDSGSYSIAFLVGVICVKFIYENPQTVSPYFIALLLWYPAIENLFSIIRRSLSKKKLSLADNYHLHHLVYLFLNKKFSKKNKILINSFSGMAINIYNLIVIYISFFFISNSKILISIIIVNLMIYLLTYSFLKKLIRFKK